MEAVNNPGVGSWWARNNPFKETTTSQDNTNTSQNNNNNNDPALQLGQDEELVTDPQDPSKKIKRKKGSDDPLLQFDSLWQPNKDKDGKPIEDTNNQNTGYLPPLDTKKLGEMVKKMNFTSDITKEQMEAIKAGGEGATTAMLEIINNSTRKAFTVSLSAANKMAEQGFMAAQERFLSQVPEHVRGMMTDNELSNSVSIMQNPAFAPLVESVKSQFLKKFPKATASQVNTAVKQYFDFLGTEITKKPGNTSTTDNTKKLQQGSGDADFMQWIEKEVTRGTGSPFTNASQDDTQNQ